MIDIYVVFEHDVLIFDSVENQIVMVTTSFDDAVKCCVKMLNPSKSNRHRIDLQKWNNGVMIEDYINFCGV
jgi:hypothetical protein